MKISKHSWHYLLLDKFGLLPGYFINRSNLCSYMRACFFAGIISSILISMIPAYPYGWYVAVHYGWPLKHPTSLMLLGTILFILDNIAILIAGGVYGLVRFIRWQENREKAKIGEAHKPGIITTYLQALKDKTCPIVYYGED